MFCRRERRAWTSCAAPPSLNSTDARSLRSKSQGPRGGSHELQHLSTSTRASATQSCVFALRPTGSHVFPGEPDMTGRVETIQTPSSEMRAAFERWLATACRRGVRLVVLEGLTGSGKSFLTGRPFSIGAEHSANIEVD